MLSDKSFVDRRGTARYLQGRCCDRGVQSGISGNLAKARERYERVLAGGIADAKEQIETIGSMTWPQVFPTLLQKVAPTG